MARHVFDPRITHLERSEDETYVLRYYRKYNISLDFLLKICYNILLYIIYKNNK